MNIVQITIAAASLAISTCAFAQDQADKAPSESSTILGTWSMIEKDFTSAADAMPEAKYSFAPTAGEFKGARTFAQQVGHVACANFAFFKEFEGTKPDEDCRYNGKEPKKTKAELMKYLRNSFQFADQAVAKLNSQNSLDKVEGPYGGPSTKLGITVLAVWHASDHYGQIAEYLRMNSIVPPASR
jgi:uncharacterized damage-inducible protein DinB